MTELNMTLKKLTVLCIVPYSSHAEKIAVTMTAIVTSSLFNARSKKFQTFHLTENWYATYRLYFVNNALNNESQKTIFF